MYDEKFLRRFWSKVDKTETCWLWIGAKSSGYGVIAFGAKMTGAHRVSLELHLGRPITKGLVVAHAPVICNNPRCVNPQHLREATQKENVSDRKLDGTMPVGEASRGPGRLTADEIKAIRNDKRPLCEVAKEYEVHFKTIGNIKNHRTYKWVE